MQIGSVCHGVRSPGIPKAGPAMARASTTRRLSRGVGLLLVLMMLALATAGAALVAQKWSEQASREKEQELLYIGNVFAKALSSYRAATPAGAQAAPPTLQHLLQDERSGITRRHLRKLYADPITGKADWVLRRDAQGGIVGIGSRSQQAPWRRIPQQLEYTDLPAATRYAEWIFTPRAPS